MLDMTDSVDGFPFIARRAFHFPLYNQTIVLAESAGLFWHVSCDLHFWKQNMSNVVLSAKVG
jgi:hypothetical protein